MAHILSKDEWLRRKRKNRKILLMSTITLFLVIIALALFIVIKVLESRVGSNNPGNDTITGPLSNGEIIKVEYLTPNPYSRPQIKLSKIKGIVIHYTANPGTSAENNHSYFEGLKTKKTTSASSHYIIGLEGEIVQCIPLTEEAYASNNRNDDTISIECCHMDATGEFNKDTYNSLISLTAALCIEYNLKEEDIIRHYDVTGKMCPLFYVEHEDAWDTLKADVMAEIKKISKTN